MAHKDHSLDQRIIDAAREEFLSCGFRKASLQNITRQAGTTTGALYTRYRGKDDLFCSLVQPTLSEIAIRMAPIETMYLEAGRARTAQALLRAIRAEEQTCMELLFQHYEECVLIFCKSGGSSLEARISRLSALKAKQTLAFFQKIARKGVDSHGIELIISEQFFYYQQILLRGYSREEAVACMKTVEQFLEAGWIAVFSEIL